jgi:hypothetical protein
MIADPSNIHGNKKARRGMKAAVCAAVLCLGGCSHSRNDVQAFSHIARDRIFKMKQWGSD